MKQRSEVEALATHELALVRALARDWLVMRDELDADASTIKAYTDAMVSKHKRDAFAIAALPMTVVEGEKDEADTIAEHVRLAFTMADAMLAESTRRALADLPVKP